MIARAGAARRRVPRGLLALVALAACDPQADSSYLGEPLLSLAGTVSGASAGAPVEAALLWQLAPPPEMTSVALAASAPVTSPPSSMPASGPPGSSGAFTLRLYQPPPSVDLRALAPGEPAFAWATPAAIPYGIAAGGVAALPSGNPAGYGLDPAHWVIWMDAPAPAGSLTAWWLGAPLPRGYALLRVAAGCPTPAELSVCVAELVAIGVPEDGTGAPGTASGYCRAPYRLAPAPAGEEVQLVPGTAAPAAGACP